MITYIHSDDPRFPALAAQVLWNLIESQSDDRLVEIVAECDSLTTSNCGWVSYTLRSLISRLAYDERMRRHYHLADDEPHPFLTSEQKAL